MNVYIYNTCMIIVQCTRLKSRFAIIWLIWLIWRQLWHWVSWDSGSLIGRPFTLFASWPLVNMKQTKRSAEEMPQDGLSRSKSLKMSEANVLETDAARSSTNSTKGLLEGLEPSDVSSSKLALILTHASSPVELFGQCSSSEMIERIFAWFGDGTMDIPWYIPGTNPPQQSIVSSMHNRQLQDWSLFMYLYFGDGYYKVSWQYQYYHT